MELTRHPGGPFDALRAAVTGRWVLIALLALTAVMLPAGTANASGGRGIERLICNGDQLCTGELASATVNGIVEDFSPGDTSPSPITVDIEAIFSGACDSASNTVKYSLSGATVQSEQTLTGSNDLETSFVLSNPGTTTVTWSATTDPATAQQGCPQTSFSFSDPYTYAPQPNVVCDPFPFVQLPTGVYIPDTSWYGSNRVLSCTASEGAGGTNVTPSQFQLQTSAQPGTEGPVSTNAQTVCDAKQTCVTGGPFTFYVDLKPPSPNCTPEQTPILVGNVDWYTNNVTDDCSAQDDGSGLDGGSPAQFSLNTSAASESEGPASTGSQTLCDKVSNCDSAGPYTYNIDQKAPAYSCSPEQTPVTVDGVQWYGSNVVEDCTAQDQGSGLDANSRAQFQLTTSVASGNEALGSTGSQSLCDRVGHCVTAGPYGPFNVDLKPPAVQCASADSEWHQDDVSIPCTAKDSGSGLSSQSDASFSVSTTVPAGTETSSATAGPHNVCDAVGNCSSASVAGNKIDKKAPSISITSPVDGASYSQGQVVTPAYACSDGGSGVQSCADNANGTQASPGSVYTAGTGHHQYTVTSTDAVGNTSSQTITYTVTGLLGIAGIPNLAATEGSQFSGQIATLTDTDGDDCGQMTATIDWGDGSPPSDATIGSGDGTSGCAVSGSHTYAEQGIYTLTIQASDSDGASKRGTVGIAVADAPLSHYDTNPSLQLREGAASAPALARFTDAAGSDCDPGQYTATISWGDGTTSTGTVVPFGGDCTFLISGADKTYAEHGTYQISISVQETDDPAGPVLVIGLPATITEQRLDAAATGSPTGTEGQAPSGLGYLLGSITDPAGENCPTSAYHVSITWNTPGSGSSTGTLVPVSGPDIPACTFSVYGTYKAASAGTYAPTVSVYETDDQADSQVTLVPTLTVADAPLTVSSAAGKSCTAGTACSMTIGSFIDTNPSCTSEGTPASLYTLTVEDTGSPITGGSYKELGTSCTFIVSYTSSALAPGSHSFTFCVSEADAGDSSSPSTTAAHLRDRSDAQLRDQEVIGTCTTSGGNAFVSNLTLTKRGSSTDAFGLTVNPNLTVPCTGSFSGPGTPAGAAIPTETISGEYYGTTVYFEVAASSGTYSYWGTMTRAGQGSATGTGKDSGGVARTYIASSSVLLQTSQLGCKDLAVAGAGQLTAASVKTSTTQIAGTVTDPDGFSSTSPDLTIRVSFGDGTSASCTGSSCLTSSTAAVRLVNCQKAGAPSLPGSVSYPGVPLDVACQVQITHTYAAAKSSPDYTITLAATATDQTTQPAPVADTIQVS